MAISLVFGFALSLSFLLVWFWVCGLLSSLVLFFWVFGLMFFDLRFLILFCFDFVWFWLFKYVLFGIVGLSAVVFFGFRHGWGGLVMLLGFHFLSCESLVFSKSVLFFFFLICCHVL